MPGGARIFFLNFTNHNTEYTVNVNVNSSDLEAYSYAPIYTGDIYVYRMLVVA